MRKKIRPPLTEAQRAFLEQNYGLLVLYASKIARYRKDLGYDDTLGLVHLTAVHAVQSYRPGKGAWSTYLWHQVRSELSHFDAHNNTLSRKSAAGVGFLSDMMLDYYLPGDQRCITDADGFMDAQLIVSYMKSVVGEDAARLYLCYHIDGKTCQALGDELGVSRQRVQQRIAETGAQIRTKLMEGKQWQGIAGGIVGSSPH